ncbi:beta-xylosidase [Umezawaea sp. Da 62-37]|uniref:beta-xylosidase n=1 Tax=Umezawaea sp. Da 62-37 TaxID=3075927 RepID=UPI0028F6D0D6|nr:beta-xylosidase [Umezawaea sp. Da 62-37]WNV84186.1 beta-xylosidase [Umezawaea sp. Da 62-37]
MPRPLRLLAILAAAALLSSCSAGVAMTRAEGTGPVDPPAAPQKQRTAPADAIPLAFDRARGGAGVIAAGGGDSPYNYGPTVLVENGRNRMWWCSQLGVAVPAGDDLLYAESPSADGPFTAPDGTMALPVLSGSVNGFDGVHTCDPSVIHVGSTYYLYYTGASGEHAHGNGIGVATSADGISWQRGHNGQPIIGPAYDTIRDNTYGSGQPAALFLDGWFYLMFTDTTGRAAGWNGAGQFVLRSKDPVFQSGVQALGDRGFATVSVTNAPRARSVVDAFSADWMWVDALNAFAIAHETESGTSLTFWNSDFTTQPYKQITVPGPWREGPGLVRTSQGHAPIAVEDPCGRVPIDVVRATVDGAAGAPTDLAHFGMDLAGVPGCATKEAASVLEGFAVPSPERTMDLVHGGKVVRLERRSVTDRLAGVVLERRPAIVDQLPVVADIPSGAQAVRSPDGQVGVLLDGGKVWLIGDETVAALNSSTVKQATDQEWKSYEQAGDLSRR